MSNLVLYHFPRACSGVTMTALEEAGLNYEDRVINIMTGEQRSPEYLKIHPGGKVPALVTENGIITENAALLIYVDSLKPEAKLLPRANTPYDRARIYSDLIWISGTVHPYVRQIRMPIRFTDGDGSGVQAKGRENLHGVLAQVSERVADGKWWYGDNWSIVDVYLNWCFGVAGSAGFPLDDYPAVTDHMNRVRQGDSFKRAKNRQDEAEKNAGIER